MKHRKLIPLLLLLVLCSTSMFVLESCGTTRTYWGVEHEYDSDYYNHGSKHKKHKKPKKSKPKKPKKHHDHDDD